MEKREDITHPSYGMIGVSRVQGHATLFGSAIDHQHYITITIRRAKMVKDLAHTWYFGNEELIEVHLSPIQYAEMISSPNVGTGVPCTLYHVQGELIEKCPPINQRREYEDDFKKKVREAMAAADAGVKEAEAILSKSSINKGDRERLRRLISQVQDMTTDTLPYIHEAFGEAMDKTVAECKGAIEEFYTHKIMSLGIDALGQETAAMRPAIPDATPAAPATPENK